MTISDATNANPLALTLTGTQLQADAGVLAQISNASFYTLAVSGTATVAQAIVAQSLASHLVDGSLTVLDSGAHVTANLSVLETLATEGKLASVTLSDAGTPLSLSTLDATTYASVLAKIGSYS